MNIHWAARESLAYEVANVTADKRATDLAGRCDVCSVIDRDRVYLCQSCRAREQSCRRGQDTAVSGDPVDRFEQWSDPIGRPPRADRDVCGLVTGEVQRGKRDGRVRENSQRLPMHAVVCVERREDRARVK